MPAVFRTLSWGIFLVILDFQLNGFDVLPDPIGYFLMINALLKLSRQTEFLTGVRRFYWLAASACLILLPISVIQLFRMLSYGGNASASVGWMIFDGLAQLLMLACIYWFVTALETQAAQDNYPVLADAARFRKWFACFLMLLALLVTPFGLNTAEIFGLVLIISFLSFFALLLVIFICRRAANVYERMEE